MASRSTIDSRTGPLRPHFDPNAPHEESAHLRAVIEKLGLQPHVEGGYFVETDRDHHRVANPFLSPASQQPGSDSTKLANAKPAASTSRSASTSIHYLLTPKSPLGAFHRNRGRTVHTLHSGRGRYVIIHADEVATPECPGGYPVDGNAEALPEEQRWFGKARIETFVVGLDVLKGERLQWIVDGGKYKCSYLLQDDHDDAAPQNSEGLLISETVIPGFEYDDHDFMRAERMDALVTPEQASEMGWMLRSAQ